MSPLIEMFSGPDVSLLESMCLHRRLQRKAHFHVQYVIGQNSNLKNDGTFYGSNSWTLFNSVAWWSCAIFCVGTLLCPYTAPVWLMNEMMQN